MSSDGFTDAGPRIDQPGERFLYNTGAMVAGILIERVTGAPFAEVLSPHPADARLA